MYIYSLSIRAYCEYKSPVVCVCVCVSSKHLSGLDPVVLGFRTKRVR